MSETDRLARLLRHVLYIAGVVLSVMALDGWLGPFTWLLDVDDSDGPGARSGFTIRTDHLTGCQYLEGRTALTPRFDATGRHICTRPK